MTNTATDAAEQDAKRAAAQDSADAEDAATAAYDAATAAYNAAFRAALRHVDPESIARVERAANAAARRSVDARIKASAARLSAVSQGVDGSEREAAAKDARVAASEAYHASTIAWDLAYEINNGSGVSA